MHTLYLIATSSLGLNQAQVSKLCVKHTVSPEFPSKWYLISCNDAIVQTLQI